MSCSYWSSKKGMVAVACERKVGEGGYHKLTMQIMPSLKKANACDQNTRKKTCTLVDLVMLCLAAPACVREAHR